MITVALQGLLLLFYGWEALAQREAEMKSSHSWLYWRKPVCNYFLKKINSCFFYEVMSLLKMISFKCMIYPDHTHTPASVSSISAPPGLLPSPTLLLIFSFPPHAHMHIHVRTLICLCVCVYIQLIVAEELWCKLEFAHTYIRGLCIYTNENTPCWSFCVWLIPLHRTISNFILFPENDKFMFFMADYNSIVERSKL